MKRLIALLFLLSGLTALGAKTVQAQNAPSNRLRSLFAVQFQLAWQEPLPDPVKLIEIGPVLDAKKQSLVLLVGGKDRSDAKRKLLVTHWDGFRFATDASTDFLGNALDALLVGHFRTPPKSDTGKAPPVTHQIVTTEGIYEWTGRALARLCEAPADLKLAILLDKSSDQLMTGIGDKTVVYEVGEKDAHPASDKVPADGRGYVRYGVGTQDYPGSDTVTIAPGVRYVQSYWSPQRRWVIGLIAGQPANLSDLPNATTGDRLAVYVPKQESRDKTFWATGRDDWEEAWRSSPLPGRVLDVRVGDPKNEGKPGLLVLLADNNDRDRRLYFFTAAPQGGIGHTK
jgi:hypothetical protein